MTSFTKFTMSASFLHQRRERKHRNCPERPSDSGQLYCFTRDFSKERNWGQFRSGWRRHEKKNLSRNYTCSIFKHYNWKKKCDKIWDRTYNTTVISIVESSVQWCNLVLHFVTNRMIWTKLSEVSTWKFRDSYKCKLFPWCSQQRPETLTFQISLPCFLSFTFTDPVTFTHAITHEG